MAKWANDLVMDAALDHIITGTRETVCSAQPTTYAEVATYLLAQKTGLTSGDYAKADGDTNGRKVTVAQQASISITTSGDATHIAIDDGSSELIYVTTCTTQTLTSGGTVTVPAWKVEISDPT